MSVIFDEKTHLSVNNPKSFKFSNRNSGCKVLDPMNNPTPTDKGSDTESKKPSENLSQPWNIIAEVLHNCSDETRRDFVSALDQKLQELEGENN